MSVRSVNHFTILTDDLPATLGSTPSTWRWLQDHGRRSRSPAPGSIRASRPPARPKPCCTSWPGAIEATSSQA